MSFTLRFDSSHLFFFFFSSEFLVAAHVRYILNITWVVDCKFPEFITYKKVEIEDEDGEDIGQYFDEITDFILEV